jgi:uncharacterized protein (DUF1778 family)
MEEKKKFNKQDYDNKYLRENKDQIHFVMEKGTNERIQDAANMLGVTRSEFCRMAIIEKLAEVENTNN